jgi:hypothetical protein
MNTDNRRQTGKHWMIMAGQAIEDIWITFWDPKGKRSGLSKTACRAALAAVGGKHHKKRFKVNMMGHQQDGWACGYFSIWYWLHLVGKVQEEEDIRGIIDLPTIPDWWCEMIWEILRLVEIEVRLYVHA